MEPFLYLIAQSALHLSNFLPLCLTNGLVLEPLVPGAGPKCFLASLSWLALKRRVFEPVGAFMTSSSRVMHFPPALVILALAVSVNLRAATVSFGTSRSLMSSVTVPTNTTILSCPFKIWAILEIEMGGLLVLEEMSLLRTVLQKAASVLLVRNLNNLMRR